MLQKPSLKKEAGQRTEEPKKEGASQSHPRVIGRARNSTQVICVPSPSSAI